MNQQEFQALLKAAANTRYAYFVKRVVDSEQVWGLYNDGWVTTEDEEGNQQIPFWPHEQFAQHFATGEWAEFEPESIDLEEFMEEWLPGMKEDGTKPSIFWTEDDSAVPEIEVLLRDLQKELENY